MQVFFVLFAYVVSLALRSSALVMGSRSTASKLSMSMDELTYIMVKPDGVQRRLVGDVISRFERKGLLLRAMKMMTPSKKLLEEHYQHLREMGFFNKLVDHMASGPVVAMVWEGRNAVKACRDLLGATNPANAAPGTIRGDLATVTSRNVCHGSDSVDSAKREIGLWFPEGLQEHTCHSKRWIGDDDS